MPASWPPSAPSRPVDVRLVLAHLPQAAVDVGDAPGRRATSASRPSGRSRPQLPAAAASPGRRADPRRRRAKTAAGPAPAVGESVADLGPRRVGRLACADHASRMADAAIAVPPAAQARPAGTAGCPNGHPAVARGAKAVHWSRARGPSGETHATRRGEDRREAQACSHVGRGSSSVTPGRAPRSVSTCSGSRATGRSRSW